MADVQPFRAIRYARPHPGVVAPTYDVISPAERERYLARDPYNVVHVTLAQSEAEAGRLFRSWLTEGILVRDAEPAAWAVAQDFVGPDGVTRRREGLVASLRVEPYGSGAVLPHERTHANPKASRLRLLRETGAQVEPIFLVHEGAAPVGVPERAPDVEVEGTRLWRVDGGSLQEFFAARQLLIADGHHRYEAALAYAEETGGASDRMLGVLVSTADPGLEIFATHRVFSGRTDIHPVGEPHATVEAALDALADLPHDASAAVFHDATGTQLVHGERDELDVELVDRFGHEGISYTPDAIEAVRLVDEGAANCAFLLRPVGVEDVFERARRGQVMPQKTTYFYPKLASGILFADA